MTATLHIELVAADRTVWSGEAHEVIARTADGDLGVLADHAPLLSLLVPGVLEIITVDKDSVFVAVDQGFLSVANNRVSILSEDAYLSDEIDSAAAQKELEAARNGEDELAIKRAEAKVNAAAKVR